MFRCIYQLQPKKITGALIVCIWRIAAVRVQSNSASAEFFSSLALASLCLCFRVYLCASKRIELRAGDIQKSDNDIYVLAIIAKEKGLGRFATNKETARASTYSRRLLSFCSRATSRDYVLHLNSYIQRKHLLLKALVIFSANFLLSD